MTSRSRRKLTHSAPEILQGEEMFRHEKKKTDISKQKEAYVIQMCIFNNLLPRFCEESCGRQTDRLEKVTALST